MAKERITINNTEKVITITNSVFESLSTIEENKISKYRTIGYELQIVDDKKRKVSASNKIDRNALKAIFTKGSQELSKVSNADDCIALYEELLKVNFQKAKGFYIELAKIVNNDKNKRHKDTVELCEYYLGLVA